MAKKKKRKKGLAVRVKTEIEMPAISVLKQKTQNCLLVNTRHDTCKPINLDFGNLLGNLIMRNFKLSWSRVPNIHNLCFLNKQSCKKALHGGHMKKMWFERKIILNSL